MLYIIIALVFAELQFFHSLRAPYLEMLSISPNFSVKKYHKLYLLNIGMGLHIGGKIANN